MDRREFLTSHLLLGAGLGLGTLLTACSGGGAGEAGSSTPGASTPGASTTSSGTADSSGSSGNPPVARSAALRHVADADPAAAVATVNSLGAQLFGVLAKAQPSANLVLSPASVAITLAMVREGAQGPTATEMDDVLHTVDPAALSPSMNTLDQALRSRSGARPDPAGTGAIEVTLKLANSVWGQQGTAWSAAFLDRLAIYYGAGLQLTSFTDDPDRATAAVNQWVSDQTAGRIPSLLSDGAIDAMTRLVLANAIYLKAPWLTPFPKTATTDQSFALSTGAPARVPMMHSSGELAYATGDGWVAVDIPYAGYELTMSVVLPDAGRLAAVEAQLPSGLLDQVVGAQTITPVTLALPRWNTASAVGLVDALGALGMSAAFDPDRADFRGMTSTERLFLGAVQHQANVSVDEAGTEAAAATVANMQATAAPVEPPVEVTVDRPFLFFIRDVPTGAVVFVGRVADPSAL
jgi:serpin B